MRSEHQPFNPWHVATPVWALHQKAKAQKPVAFRDPGGQSPTSGELPVHLACQVALQAWGGEGKTNVAPGPFIQH